MIKFTLPIEPVAKGRPRFSKSGHAYTPEKTRRYEAAVKAYSRKFAPRPPFTGPVSLTCVFYMPPPKRKVREHPTCKPDLDNLTKPIKDALNGIMWLDDGQVTKITAYKVYDWTTRETKTEVQIEEIKGAYETRI